jgi:hypothetical protein
VNNFPQATDLLTQKTARSRRFAEFIKVHTPYNTVPVAAEL